MNKQAITNTIETRRRSAGYSLVEVLIAMAILGTIALSIVTLLVMGRRNVYSGRQMTHGVALGNQVLEDVSNMTLDQIYAGFGIGATSALGTYTIDGVSYTNVLLRSTKATIVPSPPTDISAEAAAPSNFLTQWRTQLGTNKKLSNGSITLVISPRNPTTILTAKGKPAPMILQLRVIVKWNEEMRQRHVILDTVKAKF
jgi:prepilin-type N-terminal cleavage/methylation domain